MNVDQQYVVVVMSSNPDPCDRDDAPDVYGPFPSYATAYEHAESNTDDYPDWFVVPIVAP